MRKKPNKISTKFGSGYLSRIRGMFTLLLPLFLGYFYISKTQEVAKLRTSLAAEKQRRQELYRELAELKSDRFHDAADQIAELKRAEAALRESEERFRIVLENLPGGVFVHDLDGRLLLVNEKACKNTGYTQEDLLDMSVADIDPSSVTRNDRTRLWHSLKFGKSKTFESTHIRKDGSKYPAEIHLSAVTIKRNPIILAIAFDITERKEAEEALRISQLTGSHQLKELEAIYNSAPVGLCVLDTQLRYKRINDRLAELNGIPASYHIGRTVREIVPSIADQAQAIIHKVVKTRQPVLDIQFTGITPAYPDSIRSLKGHWLPLIDDAGKVIDINVVIEDITEKKRAEEKLKDAKDKLELRVRERTAELSQRAKQLARLSSELTLAEQRERRRLAEILHDHLQQFLVAARMNCETLFAGIDTEYRQDAEDVLRLISKSIEASRSLTAELSPPVLKQGSLSAALEWLARWMQENHGLTVELQTDSGMNPQTEEVALLFFQSVRELLFNVVKHAGVKSAKVEMSHDQENRLRVAVIDQGAGFDPETIREKTQTGNGFGLFSIRERLELLAGRLEVESSPGKGAAFSLLVPLKTIREQEKGIERIFAEIQKAKASGGKIQVLLADDHTVVRQGLSNMLTLYSDIEIIGEASDGEAAVAMARELRPDVILMDINMPKIHGLEATRRIKTELPEVRVIGLSMHEDEQLVRNMRLAGAEAFVSKAASSAELLKAIYGKTENPT